MCNISQKKFYLITTPVGAEGDSNKLSGERQEDFCDLSKQPAIIQWMDKVGIILYKKSREKGFSVVGSLFILGHAYSEQATTERGRKVAYQTNNWWNIGQVTSRNQKVCKKISRFACFDNLDLAYEAYYDRITSKSDLIQWKNPNYNPSYPLLGALFKKEKAPTSDEILEATRILVNGKQGTFIYCDDEDKLEYGNKLIKCAKIAKKDILIYIERQLKCLEQQKSQNKETENSKSIYLFSKPLFQQEDKVSIKKKELEEIKQEINTK